ncbi:glutamyl-tRNA reductase [Campylobacter sp. RM9344]|uniref:Glutamyl-tRNA reductase n=1 Tax=Campylobacter californiensis TaxID=1032243 RepID=A0AAW3ZSM1_9BACT|nr:MULTISPECIES: glutamyl-tRNA reductase [unclassified Campylobacter]MBE2983777.1 glutamyl-tRNA reductase [Campylobacter sp. RM6883]MBE2985659.1 glutamyl-tRNA reductase [Campylobacter sp. RM12919]MBE2987312.1 glutamyl-tRNA reductase [Campylobacter sp. RM12920]MBE2994315.1 glutamyl-tRNA reductase [Campylobacter sp. RM6913]MBE3028623.1 glutamyl-tRNA reductase [Campylobacter sp. RM9344]
MHYLSISFTHKNTDIEVREKLAFDNDEKKEQILRLIKSSKDIDECMVLSTCNRVEALAYVTDTKTATNHIIRCIAVFSGVFEDELFERADIYEDSGAIHHLFSVASSLDSLVVGETQIVGQLKAAFKFAVDKQMCSNGISKAIHYACKCAAKVRNETQISKNPISVSSVAVAKAKEIFTTLEGKTAIVVGAGEMGELAAKHLIANGANVIIINRSTERVEELVDELGDKASWDSILKLKEYINKYDLIFSSTSAPHAVITGALIEPCEFRRYFFDIAVPRDIDLVNTDKINVYTVDNLEEIVMKNLALREEQAQLAYSIVGQSTNEFLKFLKDNISIPVIKAVREQAKICAKNELEKAIKKGYLKNSDHDEAQRLIHQVFKAFLHLPTVNLKTISTRKDAQDIADAMKFVFGITSDENESLKIDMEKNNEIF